MSNYQLLYPTTNRLMQPKRARREAGHSRSVFRATTPPVVSPLTSEEREYMSSLCAARNLSRIYYEAALTIWMRCKHCYSSSSSGDLKLSLLTALLVTIKWMGPADLTHHTTSVRQAQEDFPDLTVYRLEKLEVTLCQNIDWVFF